MQCGFCEVGSELVARHLSAMRSVGVRLHRRLVNPHESAMRGSGSIPHKYGQATASWLVAPHLSAMRSGVATDLLAHHQLVRNAELRACDGWSIPTSPQCGVFTSDQPSTRHGYLVAPHESAMWSGVATELVGRHQLVRNAELWTYDSWSIPTSPQCGVPDSKHASEGGGVEGRMNVDKQVGKQPSKQRFIARVINLVFQAQS